MRHFFKIMKTDQIYDLFIKSKGINTDSRSVREGEIFFALWGEKYNGNKYAAEALEKGAAIAVIDDPLFETEKTILIACLNFRLLRHIIGKNLTFRYWLLPEQMARLQQKSLLQQFF
jgi:UDP-N-acetylmuramyl pentapeptide synthase